MMTETATLTAQIAIDGHSRIPKYQQVVNSILHNITQGNLTMGAKIPSINEISEACYLSRDTVEKAYNQLKERKVIVSVKGKGYYVTKTDPVSKHNVLFMINKPSSYKMSIYNSFVREMGNSAEADLYIYHCDPGVFLNLLEKKLGHYDYYVMMPHFRNHDLQHVNYTEKVLAFLRTVPQDKLMFLDNMPPCSEIGGAAIYQDFKQDIYEALSEGINKLKKYHKLILVYPNRSVYPYPREILQGFRRFCNIFSFDYEVLEEVYEDMELHPQDAYIIIEENDLVNWVKQVRDQGLTMGKDVGVVSYNDTPLKELLGITVISTDFKVMGETAAYMILKNKHERVKNAFRFIDRNSM